MGGWSRSGPLIVGNSRIPWASGYRLDILLGTDGVSWVLIPADRDLETNHKSMHTRGAVPSIGSTGSVLGWLSGQIAHA